MDRLRREAETVILTDGHLNRVGMLLVIGNGVLVVLYAVQAVTWLIDRIVT